MEVKDCPEKQADGLRVEVEAEKEKGLQHCNKKLKDENKDTHSDRECINPPTNTHTCNESS